VPSEAVADLLADPASCYRAVSSRDSRWDGRLYLGVVTTGVYCRPSCAARTPLARNCRYFGTAAAAVAAGFRACRRCRPDALPGTRDDDVRADLAARALRLIRDGVVDEIGVAGVAARLHVSERHLHRVLLAEVGVGPLRLAQSRRAQVARLLVEQSDLTMTDVAFASGFSSVRQFNDVMRDEFGRPPSSLRGRRELSDRRPARAGSRLTVALQYREPYAVDAVWTYLSARLVPGVEERRGDTLVRRQRGGASEPSEVHVDRPSAGAVRVGLDLTSLDDLGPLVGRLRRWLDLDADPTAVDEVLGADSALAHRVRRTPGMRVPGSLDGFELATRAVVGQQVSVAGARTMLGRLAAEVGPGDALPSALEVAQAGDSGLRAVGLTGARAATLVSLAEAVTTGRLALDPGTDRDEARAVLRRIRGIGAWTTEYIALRALADPDAWPGTDLLLARRVASEGCDPDRWRPWRGYAAMHLWTEPTHPPEEPA
jgi:AraC family transcriptional regulator of adaptative response / DNA-3-methyladenine glycosylase II